MTTYKGTFRKLIAWQNAKALAKEVYRVVNKFPSEEKYGLSSQMKRASISVMSNLAEGNQRAGEKDTLNFFNISFSSLTELDCQCEVAYELGYMTKKDYDKLIELVNKTGYLIFRLIESKKNPNSPHSRQSPNSPNKKGFSLVELLVVVSIVAVLSISSIVGFGYLGDILRVREVAGYLSDLVKQEELKVLRGDFEKATIRFLSDYVVIEEQVEGADVILLNLGSACGDDYEIDYQNGNLTKRDGEGEVLQVRSVISNSECVDFKTSEDLEWNYQVTNGDQFSKSIRFIHFNLQRENLGNSVVIITGAGARIEITAPYGKKHIYDNAPTSNLVESLDITIQDTDQNSINTLTFK